MTPVFVRTILDVAAQVEAEEARIKDAVLEAAAAGDCQTVIDIVLRWKQHPVSEVLAEKGLEACGGREVRVVA